MQELENYVPLFSFFSFFFVMIKVYYKMRWNYYKLRQLSSMDSCYETAFYCKVRHGSLRIAMGLLKKGTIIVNCTSLHFLRLFCSSFRTMPFFFISHTQTITIHYIYNSLQVTVIVYKKRNATLFTL